MNLKRGDLVVVAVIIAAAIFGVSWQSSRSADGNSADMGKVIVTNFALNQTVEFDLNQNASYQFQGTLGAITVTVENGRACISHSTCPDKLCVKVFGWVEGPEQFCVCSPISVMLRVERPEEGGNS